VRAGGYDLNRKPGCPGVTIKTFTNSPPPDGRILFLLIKTKKALVVNMTQTLIWKIVIAREKGTEAISPFSMRLPRLRAGRSLRRAGTHLFPLLAGFAMTEWERGSGDLIAVVVTVDGR